MIEQLHSKAKGGTNDGTGRQYHSLSQWDGAAWGSGLRVSNTSDNATAVSEYSIGRLITTTTTICKDMADKFLLFFYPSPSRNIIIISTNDIHA